MLRSPILVVLSIAGVLGFGRGGQAHAGVFNTPQFVLPGHSALGFEPVLTLSDGAGIGFNARYTQGLTDSMDGNVILGTGSGPLRFRIGGNLVFDFVPDIDSQPGIGIAAQPIYYRRPNSGMLELTGVPYIHKAFAMGRQSETIDPFFAFPIGFDFSNGTYHVTSTLAVGAMWKANRLLGVVGEFGIGLNNAESYISGGIAYYP